MRPKVPTSNAIAPLKAYPLNSTTLLITERDATGETPNIILKRYLHPLLIIDTGLGSLYPSYNPPPPHCLPSFRTSKRRSRHAVLGAQNRDLVGEWVYDRFPLGQEPVVVGWW